MPDLNRLARDLAGRAELERALPEELVDALRESGLPRAWVPSELGGAELHPAEAISRLADLAAVDGATAWCAMIALTSGAIAAHLTEPHASQIFGDPAVICGGVFAPRGTASHGAGDEYSVSGRWSFASGSSHSDWLMGGCLLDSGDGPLTLPGGGPDVHMALMRRSQLEIEDTWTAFGLCATASHDMLAEGAVVPEALLISMFNAPALRGGALYRLPRFGRLALGIAAVALGIAGGALRDAQGLLARERSAVQSAVAQAHAELSAARSYLGNAIDAAWAQASAQPEVTDACRAELRIASSHAVAASEAVIDSLYALGGGAAIYASSPLQRRFRDIHVLSHHMMVAPGSWQPAGRVLLGCTAGAQL